MYNLQPEEDRKVTGRGCINLLAIIGALALAFVATAFAVIFFPIPSASVSSSPATREAIYKIRFDNGISDPRMSKCAEFSTTYATANGTAQEDMEACIGVNYAASFQANRGDHLYFSIQNIAPRSSAARFSCMIVVGGETIAEVESIGYPNIASCSTSMP